MAWTAGGNISVARYGLGGAGSNSAAIAFAGYTTSNSNVTDEYDGATWSAGGNVGTAARYAVGHGTLTAGLKSGGYTTTYVATCEEYDGTTWAAGGSLATARYAHAGFGTQTAGVVVGGSTTVTINTSEEYDGTTWSAGGNLPANRSYSAGCGILTAGLTFGGIPTTVTDASRAETYAYDGTTWSTGGNLITGVTFPSGSGESTAAIKAGGATYSGGTWTNYSNVELYNGTSWSAHSNITTARRLHAAAQSGDTAIIFGGTTGTLLATTEMGPTIFNVSSLIGTFTIPDPSVPTLVGPSPLIGAFTVPAPTIISSIKILADPLTAIFAIPDVVAGAGFVSVDPLIATFTMPGVTVSLPAIVTVSPLTGTFYILDPYVVAAQKSILFGAYNLPTGKTMSYKIVDDTETTIQDWTTTGVVETVVDATADKSIYTIRTNKVNENFQGKIMWKSSDATPLTAVEIINIYSSYVDILQNRVTAQRATNLDNLDGTITSRLADASYTAPDNAGIAAIQAKTDNLPADPASEASIAALPTLATIEGSSVLAKEAALTAIQGDIDFLLAVLRNKRYLEKSGPTWYLVVRNDADTADILRKALKGTNGTTEITDIQAAALGMEMKSNV